MYAGDTVVDEGSERIHEQDCQHHSFGVAGVEETHRDAEHTDQDTVNPLAGFCLAGSYRVGGHEDGTECKAAVEELHVAGDVGYAGHIADPAHQEGAGDAAAHDLPACDAGPEQEACAEEDGDDGSFTYRTGDGSDEQVPESRAVLGGAVEGEGSRSGEGVSHGCFAFFEGYPAVGAGHVVRVGEEEERARKERGVPDVHSGAAEDFLAEDYREGNCQGKHPQRNVHGNNERDEEAANEVALAHFLATYLA